MPTKKSGCLRNFLAVLFTTIVTPVLANVIAQDVKDWQQQLERTLEGKPATPTDWNHPTVEVAGRPPAAPIQTPPAGKFGDWHWAAGAWGQ